MKYTRLTKQQFETLHLEFAQFLASQSIDKNKWDNLKAKNDKAVEGLLDIFSDLTWDKVLENTKYLENNASDSIYLFKVLEYQIHLIAVKTHTSKIDLTVTKDLQWVLQNLKSESISIYTANKEIEGDKKKNIFNLIQQGAQITKGELYEAFNAQIEE